MKYTAEEKNYMDWVRTLPCSLSGYIGDEVDPHHAKGYAYVTGSGGGIKGNILSCMPLRHELHQELHTIGHKTFEEKYNFSQMEAALRTVIQAHKDGIITL